MRFLEMCQDLLERLRHVRVSVKLGALNVFAHEAFDHPNALLSFKQMLAKRGSGEFGHVLVQRNGMDLIAGEPAEIATFGERQHGLLLRRTRLTCGDEEMQACHGTDLAVCSLPSTRAIDATNGVPQIAPGFLARLEHAVDWEQHRRNGLDFPLQPPEAAIPPAEDAVSIAAAMAMRGSFAQDSSTVLALFDALVELLTGGARKH